MAEQFQNFFVTKLREACDAVATTIYVETVPSITEGTLVLEYANSTKHEIIHFTGVSGYGLTGCTRGLEGTTAQSHSAGTDVRQNLTAGMIDKIINGVITTENIANSAVTTAKINNGAVTADKIDFTTFKSGNYSTTEKKTEYKWVDGKYIYKKTINVGTLTNGTTKQVRHDITNLSAFVRIEGICQHTNKTAFSLPYAADSSVSYQIALAANDTYVNVSCGNDRTAYSAYVTLYYTKTS